jgi:hypothetical protein
MFKALRTYAENGYDGVLIPDHTPQATCAAPWHAGMAYANRTRIQWVALSGSHNPTC